MPSYFHWGIPYRGPWLRLATVQSLSDDRTVSSDMLSKEISPEGLDGSDRSGPGSASILGAYNIFLRYNPLLDHRLRRVLGPHRQQPGQWVLFTYNI